MAWTGLNLTVEGRNALNKAQTSGELNFKSIVVGDGDTPANFSTMQGLVHQLYEVEDLMVEVKDDSCTLTADFPVVDYDYYFREIGVMVNTDEGAKLYVYDNCGVDAQYIVTTSGVESTRKRIRLLLKISDVAEITVEKPEVLYVSYTDMQKSQAEMEERINEALEEKADNSAMTAATADTAGKAGLVPAPEAGVQTEYLRGDGTWESVDDHIAVFDSGDAVEPTGWANIDTVESGEKHKSLWRKFSLAVKNLRYLYKKLGATDISGIGDGSVTGALSALNTDMLGLAGKSIQTIYTGHHTADSCAINVTDYHISLICIRMTVASNPLLVAIISWYGNPASPSGTLISPIIGNTERFYVSMIHDDRYTYVTVSPTGASTYMISVIGLCK